jgi:hypothetical protein
MRGMVLDGVGLLCPVRYCLPTVEVTTEAHAPLVYVHIPKTAGTAFRRLIGRQYPERFRKAPNTFTHSSEAEERVRRILADSPPPLAIAGHLVFGLRDVLPPGARYLTILRDPVERTLSHYAYLVAPRDPAERPHGLLARETPYRSDLTLEECLADPRYLPDNLQTRMLVARRSPFEDLPADALERAKEHLRHRFAFVGVTERLDEFTALLTVSLGWRAALPRQTRVGERRIDRSSLTPSELRALEEHNVRDRELYELARELQDSAAGAHAAELEFELEVLARARELREAGGVEPVADGSRDRQVDARARLLLEHERAYRQSRKVSRGRG